MNHQPLPEDLGISPPLSGSLELSWTKNNVVLYKLYVFETEDQHANTKAQEAIDHLIGFCQVERRFHSREVNHQPRLGDLGISPPLSGSLELSWTKNNVVLYKLYVFETEDQHANTKAQEAIDHLIGFCQVERRFHSREVNHQPRLGDLGISPPLSGSLGLSWTKNNVVLYISVEVDGLLKYRRKGSGGPLGTKWGSIVRVAPRHTSELHAYSSSSMLMHPNKCRAMRNRNRLNQTISPLGLSASPKFMSSHHSIDRRRGNLIASNLRCK